ncbi:MAG: site-specific DNA-methyltransferase [Bacteroidota bacterium]
MAPSDHINSRNCWLNYPGKIPEAEIWKREEPYQVVTTQENPATVNSLYFGDNLPILKLILPTYKGKVDLIYVDPPFGTGQHFSNYGEETAYEDSLLNHHFLEFLRQRILVLKAFLSERGSFYLHIDKKIGHYVKLICDEVFGFENFLNDITRIKCNPKNFSRKAYGSQTDMVLFYANNRDQHIWNEIKLPLSEEEVGKLFPKKERKKGSYTTHPLHAPGETKEGDTGKLWKGLSPPPGRHWRYQRAVLDKLDEEGLIEWSDTGNPRKKVFAQDHPGKKIQDIWEFKDKGLSYVSYPTEKNREFLQQLILQSSHAESLVMDAFAGSGGTLWVAEQLGRKWIGIDQSDKAQEVLLTHCRDHQLMPNMYHLQKK